MSEKEFDITHEFKRKYPTYVYLIEMAQNIKKDTDKGNEVVIKANAYFPQIIINCANNMQQQLQAKEQRVKELEEVINLMANTLENNDRAYKPKSRQRTKIQIIKEYTNKALEAKDD